MDLYNPTQNSVIVSSLKFLVAIGTMIYISMLFRHSEEKFIKSEYSNDTNHTVDATEVENMSFTHKPIEIQPHCPLYMNAILHEILVDLYVKREMCTPQDIYNLTKHKIPKITDHKKIAKSKESKGAMVVYLAVGLLMTSLCCAFVEVFKAKHQPTEKSKPGLNRTCSLADLTVLRHNRKELMRRDSVMDMGEHRASKLLDRQTPLLRRSSFPVGPDDCICGYGPPNRFLGCRSVSRKSSLENDGTFPIVHRHTHMRLLHRH